MLDNLTSRLSGVMKTLRGNARLRAFLEFALARAEG